MKRASLIPQVQELEEIVNAVCDALAISRDSSVKEILGGFAWKSEPCDKCGRPSNSTYGKLKTCQKCNNFLNDEFDREYA